MGEPFWENSGCRPRSLVVDRNPFPVKFRYFHHGLLGGGLGWRLRETEQTSFSLLFGGSFNQEFFSGGFTRRTAEIVAGEELSHQLFDGTTLTEKLVFYPNVSESGEFRIQFDTSISTEVGKRFAWHVTFSDRFLSNPLPDLEKNDILFATGVRFNFGKGS